jgi:hypothetical protein
LHPIILSLTGIRRYHRSEGVLPRLPRQPHFSMTGKLSRRKDRLSLKFLRRNSLPSGVPGFWRGQRRQAFVLTGGPWPWRTHGGDYSHRTAGTLLVHFAMLCDELLREIRLIVEAPHFEEGRFYEAHQVLDGPFLSAGCSGRVSYGSDQKAKRIPTVGATLLLYK